MNVAPIESNKLRDIGSVVGEVSLKLDKSRLIGPTRSVAQGCRVDGYFSADDPNVICGSSGDDRGIDTGVLDLEQLRSIGRYDTLALRQLCVLRCSNHDPVLVGICRQRPLAR